MCCPKVLLLVCGIHHCHQQPSMSNLPEYGCEADCFVADMPAHRNLDVCRIGKATPTNQMLDNATVPLLSMSTSLAIASCVIQRHRSSDIRSESTFAFRFLSNWVSIGRMRMVLNLGMRIAGGRRWTQVDVGGRRWTQVD